MRAQRLVGAGKFELVRVPVPQEADLRPGDVLLRVLAGAICGSDLPHVKGKRVTFVDVTGRDPATRAGFPLHEVVGEVIASADDSLVPGQRVVGWADRFDGLADYVVTTGSSVVVYDPTLPPAVAVAIQPLACVLDTLAALPDYVGKHVAVIGQGPIGLLFSHAAKHTGASFVTGVDVIDRTDVQEHFGVDRVVVGSSDRWAAALAEDERPDIVIEAVGHQQATLIDAVEAVRPGGAIYVFGIPDEAYYAFPIDRFLRKNLTLKAGAVWERRSALERANDYLVEHRDLGEHYLTNTYPLEEAEEAFRVAGYPRAGRLKVSISG